jgi:hypothetical protein
MASNSKKLLAVLCDDEVGECLLGSEAKESLSDSQFELDDCALLDVVVDGDSDEDDTVLFRLCMGGHEQLQGAKGKFHG